MLRLDKISMGLLSALIGAWALLGCPAPAEARSTAQIGDYYLSAEMVGDKVWHFELSAKDPDSGPIAISTMVDDRLMIVSDPAKTAQGWGAATSMAVINQDKRTLTIEEKKTAENGETVFETAFVITPYAPEGSLAGINFSGERYTHLFGLGANYYQYSSSLNLMGQTIVPAGPFGNQLLNSMESRPSQVQVPMIYALGQGRVTSGLFIDETRPLIWNLRGREWTAALSGPLGPDQAIRFYVILGDGLPSVRTSYMDLIGHTKVSPKSAFGLWFTGLDYANNPKIFTGSLDQLKKNMPNLTGLILTPNQDSAGPSNAPRLPFELIGQYGLEIMAVESPYVPVGSPLFTDMAKQGLLVTAGGLGAAPLRLDYDGQLSGLVDYTNANTATYWHSLGRSGLVRAGVRGFRLQGSELDAFNLSAYYDGSVLRNNEPFIHSHYAWANRFVLSWLESIDKSNASPGMNQNKPRLFFQSRTGLPGLGRFGGALFSNEGSLFFNRSGYAARANLSLTGIDYYGIDLEGTLKRRSLEQYFPSYSAWMLQSAFLDFPLVVPFQISAMPVAAYNIGLRQRFEPYYYSLAHVAHENGSPVMAPLVYYFQDDDKARDRYLETMLGPSVLIAGGVTSAMEKTEVYLPKGKWYNWRDKELFHQEEGGIISLPCKFSGLISPPILIRAGSIIMLWETFSGKDGAETKVPLIQAYLGDEDTTFTWYEDDQASLGYSLKQTNSSLENQLGKTGILLERTAAGAKLTIKARQGAWPDAPATRQVIIDVYGVGNPGDVSLDDLPYSRVATLEDLNTSDAAWISTTPGHVRFKSPVMDVKNDHVFWIK